MDPAFLEFFLPLFSRLNETKLLRRCVPGYSQNCNETLNAMVWNKCPKHKNRGFIQVDTAARSAAISFNSGASARHIVMEEMKIAPSAFTTRGSLRKDRKRVRQSLERAKKEYQDRRAKIQLEKLQAEEKVKKAEDVLDLC